MVGHRELSLGPDGMVQAVLFQSPFTINIGCTAWGCTTDDLCMICTP